MSEQLFLFDTPRPSASGDDCFLAITPESSKAAHITYLAAEQQAKHKFGGKLQSANRLHISLHFLGGLEEIPRPALETACKSVADSSTQFNITFNRVSSFKGKEGKRPLVLLTDDRDPSLREFCQRLGLNLSEQGVRHAHYSKFTPHMTLLYGEQGDLEENIDPISWTVRDFVLVQSLVGKTLHIPIHRWSLRS